MFTDWRPKKGGEAFNAGGTVYRVDDAKRILRAIPRESVELAVEGLRQWSQECSPEEVNDLVDLTVPVICLPDGFPIDGWSRIKVALDRG